MIIEFRGVTKAGNNVHAEVYFDGMLVSPNFNCTPTEFARLVEMLNIGAEAVGNEQVTITQT